MRLLMFFSCNDLLSTQHRSLEFNPVCLMIIIVCCSFWAHLMHKLAPVYNTSLTQTFSLPLTSSKSVTVRLFAISPSSYRPMTIIIMWDFWLVAKGDSLAKISQCDGVCCHGPVWACIINYGILHYLSCTVAISLKYHRYEAGSDNNSPCHLTMGHVVIMIHASK